MKRTLILISLLLVLGCIQQSKSLPADLEIRYTTGACQMEKGTTTIFIDAQGNGVYYKGSGTLLANGSFQNEEFRKTFKLNETERLELLNTIENSGFFTLNNYYTNTDVYDGECRSIFVTKNNSTKSVAVSNTQAPDEYSKAGDAIVTATEKKTLR